MAHIQPGQYFGCIPHLWNSFGRYKTTKINGVEAYSQQGVDVSSFGVCLNKLMQALHSIPGALNYFNLLGIQCADKLIIYINVISLSAHIQTGRLN
jgi:hypothetical protein